MSCVSDMKSLVGIGDLGKPATVLIEKISDAVGGIFRPCQVVRLAKAEAEAERIRAESQIAITDLHRRAFHRWLDEEAKKQSNMEEITRQALPLLEDKAEPDKIEDDWITNFFDKSRLISDSDMQVLWSKILAGEANSPGRFSKRTVNFLSSLDKSDAKLFTDFCTFCWAIMDSLVPLVMDVQDDVYQNHGLSFSVAKHLDSIGLISFNSVTGYALKKLGPDLTAYYYGQPTYLKFAAEQNNDLDIGSVLLTKIGQELASISGSKPDSEFREYVLAKWRGSGLVEAKADAR